MDILTMASEVNAFIGSNIYQLGGAGACAYSIAKLIKGDKLRIKNTWKKVMKENGLVTDQGDTYNIKVVKAEYGYMLIVRVPEGCSWEQLQSKQQQLEDSLGGVMEFEWDKFEQWGKIKLITHPLKDLKYEPVATKPFELYLGYTYYKHIVVDMNTLPHLLIAGINGSGKTRGLYTVLTTLIHNHKEDEVELYMSQIGKTDLLVYRNCIQVKAFARTPEDSLKMYQGLYKEMVRREKLIESLMNRGIINIETYNQKGKDKLKYVYVVSDEFSLYMPDNTDSKDEKQLKEQCLDILKKLIKLGRAYGVFVIICLQRTTSDQMPMLLKSQINVKVTFKQTDVYSSRNIIDCDDALELQRRECIILSDSKYKAMTPFIDDDAIKRHISPSLVKQPRQEPHRAEFIPSKPEHKPIDGVKRRAKR